MDKELTEILTEEIDEETLSKLPFWFKTLRENYRRRNLMKSSDVREVVHS